MAHGTRIAGPVLLAVALTAGAGLAEETGSTVAPTRQPAAGSAPPSWFLEHVERMAGGSGRWTTDNSAYKSDTETDEAYGIEWVRGPGGTSLSGRLFGLREGRETNEYWRFQEYWNPVEGAVVAEQFGDGVFGTGRTELREDGTLVTSQTFHSFQGGQNRVGHHATNPDPETHVTRSFNITAGGEWTPRRVYTWKRQP